MCAARRAGIRARDSAPAESRLRDQEKMHRVGLASVQPTRSTFAEATAGRESLQPRALRARCTRKPTGAFGRRQAPVRDNVSQIAIIVFSRNSRARCGRECSCDRECGRAFRDVPRRRRGIKPRDSAPAESRLRTRKCTEVGGSLVRPPNRPPPKRLPVGGPSTSGAPSSVQSGHYGAVHAPSSRNRSRNPQFAIFSLHVADNCVSTLVL
jgi:hypothetical protein